MADFNAAVMTNSGIELLSRTLAGQAKIKFTVLKAGNGIYTAEEKERSVLQTRTELKSEKQTFPFSGIEIITDSSVKLSALMSNNDLTEGYYINEIGIYAVDEMEEEGEEILYSIAIANVADYFPKYNNLSPSTIIQEYYTTVDNSLQVTIQTGLAAVALAEDLLKTIERVKILENPEFDDSGGVEGISSFTDFFNSVKNKMNIFQFFKNFKAGLKFIVHTGMIVDNFATKEKGFLPDATLVTALKEQLDEQNNNINMKFYYNPTQLGLDYGCSVLDIINAMPDNSIFTCYTSAYLTIMGTPETVGILQVVKNIINRCALTYRCTGGTAIDKIYTSVYNKSNIDDIEWKTLITNSDLTQYLSINQYMKNFVIGSKGTKTIQLPSGIFLVSWGQYGAWSDKGTAIVYNSTYQSTASKDIYILFQRETSITLSQSIDGKLTITNSIVAEMPISIIEIGGPKFYDFTV